MKYVAAFGLIAVCACNDVVASDQLGMQLVAIDGKPLPRVLESSLQTTTTVTSGMIVGSPSKDGCDYTLTYRNASIVSGSTGSVTSCRLEEGAEFTASLTLTNPYGPVGEHAYTFR
jgi:hypothetical protein